MSKIDRLGWASGLSFVAYGVRIGIRTNHIETLEELNNRLPLGAKLASSPLVEAIFSFRRGLPQNNKSFRQYHLVYGNFAQLIRSLSLEDSLDVFERELFNYVAEQSRQRVFVHAGVIGWRGKAIVIPGRSLSGKSSLVMKLVKAGATYYSDDYAILDDSGNVHPYPIPIGIRKQPNLKQEKYPIETIGGVAGKKPLPIGLVLATSFKEGSCWRPKSIPAGQGLLTLLSNTVSAQRNPAKALATLQQVVTKAPVLKGVRGEAEEVVDALLNKPWPTL